MSLNHFLKKSKEFVMKKENFIPKCGLDVGLFKCRVCLVVTGWLVVIGSY